MELTDKEYVEQLVARAKKAQEIAFGFSQEYVDSLTRKIGWALASSPGSRSIPATTTSSSPWPSRRT